MRYIIRKKDVIWNTIGSLSLALAPTIMSFITINLLGVNDGGVVSFGFSTLASIAFVISYFGMKTFHIVDIIYKYNFREYMSVSVFSFVLSIVLLGVYIFYNFFTNNYNIDKVLVLGLCVVFGSLNGLTDNYESEFQRSDKLYLSGIGMLIKILVFFITFLLTLLISKNLLISLILALCGYIAVIYFYYHLISKRIISKNNNFSISDIINLVKSVLPIFLIVFLDMYVYSASKIAIDKSLLDIDNGIFNIIFLPSNILYLLINFIIRPMLTNLSEKYLHDKNDYNDTVKKITLYIFSIGIVCVILSIFLSSLYFDIINILVGGKYTLYADAVKKITPMIVVGSVLYVSTVPIYNCLIIENKQKYVLIVYALVFIPIYFMTRFFVGKYDMYGAGVSFIVAMLVLFTSITMVKKYSK